MPSNPLNNKSGLPHLERCEIWKGTALIVVPHGGGAAAETRMIAMLVARTGPEKIGVITHIAIVIGIENAMSTAVIGILSSNSADGGKTAVAAAGVVAEAILATDAVRVPRGQGRQLVL